MQRINVINDTYFFYNVSWIDGWLIIRLITFQICKRTHLLVFISSFELSWLLGYRAHQIVMIGPVSAADK